MRWFNVFWCVILVILAGGIDCTAADGGKVYVVTAHFLLLSDSEPNAEVEVEDSDPRTRKPRSLRLGSHELVLGRELLFDGVAEFPEGDDSLKLLSSPRIMIREGKEATLRASVDAVPQFFEEAGDGSYVLGTLDPKDRPRLDFKVLVADAPASVDGDPRVDLDFTLDVVYFSHREQLPGVGFDVGRPVVRTTSSSGMMLRMNIGIWDIISVHLASGFDRHSRDRFVVLVKIDEAE